MKKIILLLIFQFALLELMYGQRPTDLNGKDIKSDTLYMGDYAYVCDTLMNLGIYYYNLENHPGRGEVKYRTGQPLNLEEVLADQVKHVIISDEIHDRTHAIVDNAFTKAQVEQLDEQKFSIVLNISSSDGSITDVYFKCWATGGYKNIPIEVFREIETRLKNEVQFELTEEGRKMNYCYLSWSQCPKGREDSGMTIPEDGGGMLTMPGGKLDGTIGGSLVGGQVAP